MTDAMQDNEYHGARMYTQSVAADAELLRKAEAAHAILPHRRLRPAISLDGNQWCALYGDNIQDGVAGFGDSTELAMAAFDAAWVARIPDGLMLAYREVCKFNNAARAAGLTP